MELIVVLLLQLFAYGVVTWTVWIAVTYCAARFGGLPGLFLGHFVIAGIIVCLDVLWIRSEMSKPGWNGVPDMDFVFHLGMLFRIVMINTVLLPLGLLGIHRRRKRREQHRTGASPLPAGR
jgi:hypothetical protein